MSGLCLKLPGRRRHRSAWSPTNQRTNQQTNQQTNRKYVVRRENMPVGMEVTEDTPPDMFTGSMNLKLVLPSGKKIKTSVDRSTPMMDLLVHVTTCHKLSPAAHVLQPYGERGVLPYKPSTPIGALDTVMVHVVPKNQLAQNQSNKMALKQVSQPFEQTYRIQVSLPRNQLYVLRANGRTTIADIHSEICNEKNLDPTKYSLRHPKELSVELKDETTIAAYKSNQLVLVSNRSNPANQLSTDDIITAIQNINKNNNNIYAFEPSSRSLSPDSSVSPVTEPAKPLRKKKPPAPKPPVNQSNNQKVPKDKSTEASSGRIISHSRTSSDSSGYHEASLLSESPPSNNSSLPDSLPRRSKLDCKTQGVSSNMVGVREAAGGGVGITQNPALSKSLSDLKVPSAESGSISAQTNQSQSSLKSAQSTTSLHTGRKKRLAPPPPPATSHPMRTVIEERITLTSDAVESPTELSKERSRTLESDRRAPTSMSGKTIEKSRTLPPGLSMNSPEETEEIDEIPITNNQDVEPVAVALAPPDERGLVMEDEEIDRIFNNAIAEHSRSNAPSLRSANGEANDSGRDSTDSNEVVHRISKSFVPSPIIPERTDSPDRKLPEFSNSQDSLIPDGLPLPSPVKTAHDPSADVLMDWEYKLPAPPTFRDLPESSDQSPVISDPIDKNTTMSDNKSNLTPRSAVMSELSSVISHRSSSSSCLTDILTPVVEQSIENTSSLNNFKITTYAPSVNENKTSVRRNNSLVRETNPTSYVQQRTTNYSAGQINGPTVKRSVSHVSLFLRPYDNTKSKSLARVQNEPSETTLRKTTSEFNIDSVGRSERPKSCLEPQALQSLQVLRSILPQLSQSQGSLNTISESEQTKPLPDKTDEHLHKTDEHLHKTDEHLHKPQVRYKRDEKVAVSLGTWGERPKRQVSIKSDRDYVFGTGGSFYPRRIAQENETTIQRQDSSSSSSASSSTTVQSQPSSYVSSSTFIKGNDGFSNDSRKGSLYSSTDSLNRQENNKSVLDSEAVNSNSDDDKKPKRVTNVYKNLETGNTKPLRQILNEVSRVPVVRSVELKSSYKEWQTNPNAAQNQSQNTRGLDRLKERFEADKNNYKDNSNKTDTDDEAGKFESTDKIRERFESAIKERYVSTEKALYPRKDIQDNSNIKDSKESTTKVNVNQQLKNDYINKQLLNYKNGNDPSVDSNRNLIKSNDSLTQKYESKVRINQDNQPVTSQLKNKSISSTKIELIETQTKPNTMNLTNRYTSVIGIGGSDDDVVRVRVKTSAVGKTPVNVNQRVQPAVNQTVDSRQQLLTSIRGFGGLESLKKVIRS